jgi:hypothetical protein
VRRYEVRDRDGRLLARTRTMTEALVESLRHVGSAIHVVEDGEVVMIDDADRVTWLRRRRRRDSGQASLFE